MVVVTEISVYDAFFSSFFGRCGCWCFVRGCEKEIFVANGFGEEIRMMNASESLPFSTRVIEVVGLWRRP
jgi:hypothetical protein